MSLTKGFILLRLMVVLVLLLSAAAASPARGYYSSPQRGGRSYTDIARVVNPNPYAFVGARNYPGQPFWPAGK
ncbi:uncharacterized protein LOC117899308 [Drosophila subobscura]|uniref:uncharacterized protein LOC117899308 n=1 Tax=Drosophila subobscura TaxID=7241 RepID=UPI00155B0FF0|nr:uncharacterized protein LOC117899308 [Drosophila subobscura]